MIALLILALTLGADIDPPPVRAADQWRFPYSREQAEYAWRFGCAHVEWLSKNGYTFTEWYFEALHCRRCWDLLDDCRRIHPNDERLCRQKLAELRTMLGPRDFNAGQMPPLAPYWHFREIGR